MSAYTDDDDIAYFTVRWKASFVYRTKNMK